MRRYLLDTHIVSNVISNRDRQRIREKIAEVGIDRVCTSVIVSAEIRYGIARKGSARLCDAADAFLRSIEVLGFEAPADRASAEIRSDLERRGLTIGPNDLLIAAHCVALGLTLVTHNTREFERVPDLAIEDWLTE